jgi:thermostable 8-oxoguanine DNA glycosylase
MLMILTLFFGTLGDSFRRLKYRFPYAKADYVVLIREMT